MYTTYLTVDCCQCGSLESLTNFLKKIASITQPTKRTAIQIIEEAKQILNEIKS
jgi:hypothetical protein